MLRYLSPNIKFEIDFEQLLAVAIIEGENIEHFCSEKMSLEMEPMFNAIKKVEPRLLRELAFMTLEELI